MAILESHASMVRDEESSRRPPLESPGSRLAPGGWSFLLVLAGVTCCLGSAVPAGFNIGVMNNAADLMQDFCNTSVRERYNIELSVYALKVLWPAVVSIFLIGGVTGSFVASWLADKVGRKGALCYGNLLGIVGAVMFLLVQRFNSIELLLLGRMVVGLSGGFATSLVPMYMAEIAPLRLRGAVGVLCQLGITCGVFLGQVAGLDTVLGTANSWHYMLGSFLPLCIIAVIVTAVSLPESPKYLFIIREEKQKALNELGRIRNMDLTLLQGEIESFQQEIEMKTSADPWGIGRILKDPTLRLPVFLVCMIQFGQQLSGINAVFYYSTKIFLKAGLDKRGSQYATLGTGIANIGMALVSVPVMSSFNRRIVLLTSIYLCVGCLVLLCVSIVLIHVASFMLWVCTIAVLAYVVFYGIGLGPIPYFIGSELFDVGPRPIAMALGSVFNWGGNFIVGMMFPIIEGVLGPYTFLIFSAFLCVLAQIVSIYLPETRGKCTMDIAATVSRGFSSRPNARALG